jgi:hypothetical protein
MKKFFLLLIVGMIVGSCAVKKPLTNALKEEYNLTDQSLKKVQFFVSSQIILERSSSKGSTGTNQDGTIVTTSSSNKDRILIQPRTKCVLESTQEDGTVIIRFEKGDGNIIAFATRPNMTNGKYYFQAKWEQGKGGKVTYGNKEEYYATSASGEAYLLVKIKKFQKNKRKDRVVKGMKV